MLSIVSELLQKLPPLVKELALLIVGSMCLVAALKGGALRDRMFGVVA